MKQALQIANLLGEYDYIVDVVDVTDRKFVATKAYDLILNHRVDDVGHEKGATQNIGEYDAPTHSHGLRVRLLIIRPFE